MQKKFLELKEEGQEMASNGNEDDGLKRTRMEEKKSRTRQKPTDSRSSRSHQHHHRHQTGASATVNMTFLGNVDSMQIGNNNKMYYNCTNNRPYTRSQDKQQSCKVQEVVETKLTTEQQSRLSQLQESQEEVNSNLMAHLSKSWGRSWLKYGRMLKLGEDILQNIEDSVKTDADKRREISYQVLVSWKKKTDDPSIRNLIQLLTPINDYSAIMSLLTCDFDKPV